MTCSYQVQWVGNPRDPRPKWVLAGDWGTLDIQRPGLDHRMAMMDCWHERSRLRTAGQPRREAEDWEELGTDRKRWLLTQPEWKR